MSATTYTAETFTSADGAKVEVGTVSHGGRSFAALGHVLSADGARLVCYLAKPGGDGVERVGARGFATDWQGQALGRYEITGRWRRPDSFIASHMVSARVTLTGGAVYVGRGMGAGMIFKAKREAPPRQRSKRSTAP